MQPRSRLCLKQYVLAQRQRVQLGLTYTVDANTGAARTGTITIGSGGTFTVNQAAAVPPQIGTITNVGVTVNNMDAIAFNSSGILYGGTSGTGSLYTIDPTTGIVTLVHALVGASNAALTYGVYRAGLSTWHRDPLWKHQPGLAEFAGTAWSP